MELWCARPRLRATAGGKKQYVFQSKIRGLGIDPRVSIGDAAAWRLPEAREQERQYKLMTDKGLAPPRSHGSEGHLRNHISLASAGGEKKRGKGVTVAGPLASLMTARLSELTSDRIATWLEKEAATRATNEAQSFRILPALPHLSIHGLRRSFPARMG